MTRTSPILGRLHWIFDLDGTLTLPVHDFAFIRRELGVPDGNDILVYLASLSADTVAPLHARLDEIEHELAERATAAPGAHELVERLSRSGVRLGILTRNSREIAMTTLAAIGCREYFRDEEIIGRGEALPKPDPDGILKLAERWGTSPQRSVMVGDYLFDLQAGRAAGAATVHVARPDGQVWPDCTDLAVASLAELAGHLP
jgi:HAD superfamily hydrolase (TIGR01509 family)